VFFRRADRRRIGIRQRLIKVLKKQRITHKMISEALIKSAASISNAPFFPQLNHKNRKFFRAVCFRAGEKYKQLKIGP